MPQPEPVQVAFRVYATDWGLRGHGSRQIDWLVDGKDLHPKNVVFVIDGPISHYYRTMLTARYRVYDLARRWHEYGHDFARWDRFLRQWIPKHWVSYNDFHPRHKIRNRILRAAGCQTWHYSHSVNLPHVYGQPNYQPWEELDYDHLVLWNETDAHAFKGGQQHILGPLFASQVPRAIVAVFDSTWEHYLPSARDLFFAGLYRYLERHPGMVMLYKPKLKPPVLPEVKNFYILPEWVEPGLVIACADLTIGLAFTSPVVEALAAGRPAVYYDPIVHPEVPIECFMRQQDDPAQRFRELLMT